MLPPIGTSLFEGGWHDGLAMGAYLADPAVSASLLWKLHTSTPAHLLEELGIGRSTTDAKELGTVVHVKVYEPTEFDDRYVVIGQCEGVKNDSERCTYAGKFYRDGQSFCGTHDPYGKDEPMAPGLVTVTADIRTKAIAMSAALRGHSTAHAILEAEGPREVTGVWRDKETGLWCRIRPDQLIGDPVATPARYHHSVVNLKTTGKVARGEPFRRDFENIGNAFKAAFYRMGVRELWDVEPQNFLYPTVESYPPFAVIVHRLHEDWLDIAEDDVRHTLRQLAECVATEQWPGYGTELYDLNIPDWRRRRLQSDDDVVEVAA